MTKPFFGVFLIVAFIAVVLFGIFAMNHGGEHGRGCIAAAVQGVADCPNQASPLTFLTFHLDAFRSFSTATVGSSLANTLLVVLGLVLFSAPIWPPGKIAPSLSILRVHQRKRQESFELPFRSRLNHWLALHENSPSVI